MNKSYELLLKTYKVTKIFYDVQWILQSLKLNFLKPLHGNTPLEAGASRPIIHPDGNSFKLVLGLFKEKDPKPYIIEYKNILFFDWITQKLGPIPKELLTSIKELEDDEENGPKALDKNPPIPSNKPDPTV